MAFTLTDGVLRIAGKRIRTEFPVKQAFEVGGVIAVLLDVPVDVLHNRNVIGYSTAGRLLWRIEENPYGGTEDRAYVSVWENEEGVLCAAGFEGTEFKVNIGNGKTTTIGFSR